MKHYLTWSPQARWHYRPFEKTTRFYRGAGPAGLHRQRTADSAHPLLWVLDTLTDTLTYQCLYDARYGSGAPTPEPIILPVRTGNFTIDARVTAQTIDPGYRYVAADPTKPLFTVLGSHLVGCHSEPGKPIQMVSADHFFYGFRNRLDIQGVEQFAVNPNVSGEAKGRAVKGEEILHLVYMNNNPEGTSGIEIKTKSDAATPYAAYLGDRGSDRFRIMYNDALNIDGRISNGQGTGEKDYRRGNVGGTHAGQDWRWNPAVPLAERTSQAKLDPAKYAPLSWMPVQFVQIAKVIQHPSIEVGHNRVVNQAGKSRVEDNLALLHGSGGTRQSPAKFHHNYVQGALGYDPNYEDGVSTVYDNSNRITQNVDGYNPPGNLTTYSGSIFIIDGYNSSDWGSNSHFTEVTDNVGVGHQIQAHYASEIKILRNRVYALKHVKPGVALSYNYAGYFVEAKTITANDGGTQRLLASGTELRDNVYFREGTGYGNISGVTEDNRSNNTYGPLLAAGGDVALQVEWMAQQAAAGLTIGVPQDRRAP